MSHLELVASTWARLRPAGLRESARTSDQIAKAVVEIESPKGTAMIEAWEQGCCLDVSVMLEGTGNVRVLSAGPCNSREEVERRLLELSHMLGTA